MARKFSVWFPLLYSYALWPLIRLPPSTKTGQREGEMGVAFQGVGVKAWVKGLKVSESNTGVVVTTRKFHFIRYLIT